MKKIGTVEILRDRVYPLDHSNDNLVSRITVAVKPGTYDLYTMDVTYFWMMKGNINTGRMFRMGDGLSTMRPYDTVDGPEVIFPSKFYGPDEFMELLKHDHATEGPEQRLRFNIDREAWSLLRTLYHA